MLNLDKVNVWGQPIPRADTVAGRIYQQMFAPAKVTKDKKTAVDNELIRLAKVFPENKTIYPALAQLYIKHKNENINLTIDEYNEWQKICGQTSLGILEKHG